MRRAVSRRKVDSEPRTMETVEAGYTPPPPSTAIVEYADEHAKASYELAEKLRQLDTTIPADEGTVMRLTPITFEQVDARKGAAVLLFTGDFMATNEDESITFVRPRTQKLLDALRLRYRVVASSPQ